ncbi:hypothetical protein CLAFUW4_04267 [Fulvia fulva]|uniref:Uncharacterized protein n=1 Tax=Passalora fulva TaxID=5499 RepID=A0A9Q8P7A7_PASFU|nr:uncharacterized protein CLAFUR5_04233 [Fulvia fulva]KAK4626072.1 hypothetical protein CLAFUR4_04253 [Fulvia fulva]KAK4627621.1 hypothetical protein CLAFUR0_04255 [Fulvia fulva]UJO15811.1 hypothetical protein CLAFUR5_04233 [Fulvia fulva]WPV14399.1 hypothetical protein CLAFUW4_04267 [Fulvia fulva]WPV28259.1 hypothetical protein CLAFUW7_04256 [Fulvia fulva]
MDTSTAAQLGVLGFAAIMILAWLASKAAEVSYEAEQLVREPLLTRYDTEDDPDDHDTKVMRRDGHMA